MKPKKPSLRLIADDKVSRQYLSDLLFFVEKTDVGKELIENAKQKNTTIIIEDMEKGITGYADDDNTIALNLRANEYDLIATLFHELRHIAQKKFNTDNVSAFQRNMITQVLEADARVVEVMGCYELDKLGEKTSLARIKKQRPDINDALKDAPNLSKEQMMSKLFTTTLFNNKQDTEFYKVFGLKKNREVTEFYDIDKVLFSICKVPNIYASGATNYYKGSGKELLKSPAFDMSAIKMIR